MQPRFWKLSQGGTDFIGRDTLQSIEQRLVYVHGRTKAKGVSSTTQGEDFIAAPVGDYFYLTRGNKGVYIIGQFTGPPNFLCTLGDGWIDRPFRFIRAATEVKPYTGPNKWWSPNNNSTFVRVPDDELGLFEESILWPHFGIRLSQFGIAGGHGSPGPVRPTVAEPPGDARPRPTIDEGGTTAATRDDWKTTPFPAEREVIALNRTYTASEFSRIRQGNVPQEMEDKWFAFYEEPWLFLHRSWTGFGVYQVRFESADGSGRVSEVLVSRDPEQYQSTDGTSDALLLAVLLDGYAGRDTDAAWEQYTASLRSAEDA